MYYIEKEIKIKKRTKMLLSFENMELNHNVYI